MWETPHDVKSWRAFWTLPVDCGPYRMMPQVNLLDPTTFDELAEWDAYWTAYHEWRCSVLEDRYHLGIHYDREEADRRLRFFRALPITSSGKWKGKRLDPLAWQEHQWLRPLYGYMREDGTRLYHDVFVFVPKKQGKSDWAAAIVLDQLFMEHEPGCEVYGAAKTHGQASNVYRRAHGMVKGSPALKARSKLLEATKRIVVPDPNGSDSFYQVLSADVDAQEGPSMQCISIDEVHVVPAELLDVLTDGSGAARTQPIRNYTTTAGDDFGMPWFGLLEMAEGIEDGVLEVPDFLPVLYMARPEDGDDWTDEAVWWKANPSLGVLTSIEEIRAEFVKAQIMPHKQSSFKRRRLNIPVADEASRFLPMTSWDACDVTGSLAELAEVRRRLLAEMKGQHCVGWLDLSSMTDLTTFGLLFDRPDGSVVPIPWFFLPKENLDKRGSKDRAYYRAWADAGFIALTEGNKVDYRVVREQINQARTDGYRFLEIAYDVWNAGKLETELTEEDGFVMVPIDQNIKQMNAPTKQLLGLTLSGQVKHGGNPVLRYMADHLTVKVDPNERVQPMKNKSTGRIDGVVGIIMALSRLIRAEEPELAEGGALIIDLDL